MSRDPESPIENVRRISAQMEEGGDEPLLTMDDFDECIVGVVRRFNDVFVLYDQAKVIAQLEAGGMTEEEAIEYFDFNQAGAWVGKATPAFLLPVEPADPAEEPSDE